MAQHILKLNGKTITNHPVYGGCFELVSTHGIPLELIIDYFCKNNLYIDWSDYVIAALHFGQNLNALKTKIYIAIGDIYGEKYKKEFEKRYNRIV